ncbi:hypothetical protein OSB04_023935 [Centaurea solstitialis]|uniref:Uncharacterized protein n=1 Tax=Centaurea solstitialis TaxID=347529 RepID=A0AA38SKT8_9ASTR|nr:hypothetical protein OSB04_023935 [Centaurea solstitialis]
MEAYLDKQAILMCRVRPQIQRWAGPKYEELERAFDNHAEMRPLSSLYECNHHRILPLAVMPHNMDRHSSLTFLLCFTLRQLKCCKTTTSIWILVGNGVVVPVRYIGQCTFPFSYWPLQLKNVLLSDKIIKNLISVRRFTIDNFVSIEFDQFGFTVKDFKTVTITISILFFLHPLSLHLHRQKLPSPLTPGIGDLVIRVLLSFCFLCLASLSLILVRHVPHAMLVT